MTLVSADQFQQYTQHALDLGFTAFASAKAGKVQQSEKYRKWVEDGFHADMEWYARNIEKRLDPKLIMASVQSILVLLTPYHQEPIQLASHQLARYAAGDDYHDVLKKKLKKLCRFIAADHPAADFRVYVDTGPVAERYWAQQAGLGWVGKNSCLIHGKKGSFFFISCILTDLEFPHAEPSSSRCGNCTACMDHCPTKAIVEPGIVDSRKCISYLNIEHRGGFEEGTDLHNWIFGCDVCQDVCPWNRKGHGYDIQEQFKPRPQYEEVSPEELQEAEPDDFQELFRKSPIKRTKKEGLLRNLKQLE
ncbi:MAG: tRNA epoxyqueuosine(34) reductase QueG [Acidobacteria bacterium]|nr:MAG: tRNA epoxyqueuosine(34) reductase QueG [Acidobacteriota bacterium]